MIRTVAVRTAVAVLATALALAVAAMSPAAASAATDPATDHAPVAVSQSVSTPQDTPIALTMHATDADGDALTYAYLDFSGCHCHVTNGTTTGTPPNIVFTPTAGFQGTAQVYFQANDGVLNSTNGDPSTWGIITVTVTAPVVTKPTKLTQCLRGGYRSYGFTNEVACLVYVARHWRG